MTTASREMRYMRTARRLRASNSIAASSPPRVAMPYKILAQRGEPSIACICSGVYAAAISSGKKLSVIKDTAPIRFQSTSIMASTQNKVVGRCELDIRIDFVDVIHALMYKFLIFSSLFYFSGATFEVCLTNVFITY